MLGYPPPPSRIVTGESLPGTCSDNLAGKAWKSFETGLPQVSIESCDINILHT